MRAGPGPGCGLLRAVGRGRVLRGARSPGLRALSLRPWPLGRSWPAMAGPADWPLPSSAARRAAASSRSSAASRRLASRSASLSSAAPFRPSFPILFLL